MKINLENYKTKEGKVDLERLTAEKPILPPIDEASSKATAVKMNRDRMETFPDRLPTSYLMPLPMDEHPHIGEYETKQNIYLTLAHAYNNLMEKIETLEKEIKSLKGKK